jgi:putative ABC transport system permease protein
MLRNYWWIVVRMMLRQRGFSLINVGGFTIGITSSLLLVLYVQHELSFDRFHPDSDRIYRVAFEGQLQGNSFRSAETGAPLARALRMETPEVESTLRMASWPTFPVHFDTYDSTEPYLLLADSNFFRFFHFNLIEGNPDEVLLGKDKLVISESAAKRFFNYQGRGDTSPLGKTLTLAQGYQATVVGIAEDAPAASHFHFTLILSLASWQELAREGWMNGLVKTYFKLKPGASLSAVEEKLEEFTQTHLKQELETYQASLDQFWRQGNFLRFSIQKLTDIHLHSHLDDEIEENGEAQYIYLFIAIAVFIILLACINFVNLSTARSASRTKEVGVRKTSGALNGTLVMQFLFESYFFTLLALLLSLLLVVICLFPFNMATGKDLSLQSLFHPYFLSGIGLFLVLVGILAGGYPAFFHTYLSPAQILKGRLRSGTTTYGIRNMLVAFQFFISIALIISTWVVYEQVHYLQTQPVGFDKSNVITLLHTANLKEQAAAFKKELHDLPGVVSASFANRMPPYVDWIGVFRPVSEQKDFIMTVYEMDPDHLQTMGYEMVSGRFFSHDPADTGAMIINETAAKSLKWNLSGEKKYLTTYSPNRFTREVIGIMRDFHFHALKDSIRPLAVMPSRQPNWEMAIRIRPENQDITLEQIKTLWRKHAPNAAFEYSFLEENYRSSYLKEKRVGNVFLIFTFLSMLIGCLGLFGLATYSAEQRAKEIGVRKVLGASVFHVAMLLTRDFTRQIILAFIVAAPLSWWALHEWLKQFPYHILFPWHILVLSGLISLMVAVITVSYKAVTAALRNPSRLLRNE